MCVAYIGALLCVCNVYNTRCISYIILSYHTPQVRSEFTLVKTPKSTCYHFRERYIRERALC